MSVIFIFFIFLGGKVFDLFNMVILLALGASSTLAEFD
jgi:hypothetical protein